MGFTILLQTKYLKRLINCDQPKVQRLVFNNYSFEDCKIAASLGY